MRFSFLFALVSVASAALAAAVSGCTPSIGDRCVLSTDCSTQGNRLCDTAQPDGYCTVFNCSKNSCPDDAHCVLFNASLQGCAYDDRAGAGGSRTGRSFCSAHCEKNTDCRPGYVCVDPRSAPWKGLVLDDNQNAKTCLVIPPDDGDGGAIASTVPPPICSPVGPNVPPYDASAPSISDAATDAPPLFVPDAGSDAGDAGDAGDAEGGI